MGGAIARGLSTCDLFRPQDITVINRRASKTAEIQGFTAITTMSAVAREL